MPSMLQREPFLSSLRAFVAALSTASILLGVADARADETANASLPLSVPVKVLPAPNAQPDAPGPNPAQLPQQRPQPTLPGGKLPQYQLGRSHRGTSWDSSTQSGKLRFVLVLPTQPLLIDAVITIDGEPFPVAREKRIQQILSEPMQAISGTEAPRDTELQSGTVPESDAAPSSDTAPSSDAAPPSEATPDEPAEAAEEVVEKSDDGTAAAAQDTAPSTPPYTLASTAAQYVQRYFTATGRTASPEEVRWLLTHRVDGPVLLMLNDNFQRFRAHQRPVFRVLDRDRDGAVSADELQRAVASFQECDLNRDEIIDYLEIAAAAADVRLDNQPRNAPGPLLLPVDDSAVSAGSDAPTPVLIRFDSNENGRLDRDELERVQRGEADLSLAVSFRSENAAESTIAVTSVGAALSEAAAQAVVDGTTMTLPLGGTMLALSAVQDAVSDQISVGAVNDGYPLLPVVDPNDDGRFTIRELRELVERLGRLDRNQDGALSADEAVPTIRLSFALGPHVHRELANIRSINPRPAAPTMEGPQWFVRMDRNRDNDLTRGEFPGTDEQFKALDADQDGLISGREASEFESKSPSTP